MANTKLTLPKRKTLSTKGPIPKPEEASELMGKTSEVIKNMNFKVTESFYHDYRMLALQQRKSMKELFETMFEQYAERQG